MGHDNGAGDKRREGVQFEMQVRQRQRIKRKKNEGSKQRMGMVKNKVLAKEFVCYWLAHSL